MKLLSSLFCLLIVVFFLTNPFGVLLSEETVSISNLNEAQFQNIKTATNRINNLVLKPGETFSFNKYVGPRTSRRGFEEAPAYLGSVTTASLGGGLCLLSSVLYKVSLISNLKIIERHPHLRPISSIKAGFDATVWYDSLDLRFQNTNKFPVKIKVFMREDALSVSIHGRQKVLPVKIERKVDILNPQKIKVQVFRNSHLLSTDFYDTFQKGTNQ